MLPTLVGFGWLRLGDLVSRQLHRLVFGLQPVIDLVVGLTASLQVDSAGTSGDLPMARQRMIKTVRCLLDNRRDPRDSEP
jgi:hypothetical protein